VLPAALKAMGWEEGRNVRIVHRWAEDHGERLPMLARELIAERPDVLVTTGDPATKALQVATATVPIITMSDDVIGGGLAASMARPGGNTTGVSILATELENGLRFSTNACRSSGESGFWLTPPRVRAPRRSTAPRTILASNYYVTLYAVLRRFAPSSTT
jgi:hypothetical protein